MITIKHKMNRPPETVEIMQQEGLNLRFNSRRPETDIELELADERRKRELNSKTRKR
jgi:hypothetical protein